jgi:hypothetical protein
VNAKCPACRAEGKAVAAQTLDHWVLSDIRPRMDVGPFLICLSPDCPVVYYTPDGRSASQSEVIARVGHKRGAGLTPVCYCFGHTREAVESELRVTGACRVPVLITAEIKAARCACETMNPEGRCCLGEVNQAIKAIKKNLASGRNPAGECAEPAACCTSHP